MPGPFLGATDHKIFDWVSVGLLLNGIRIMLLYRSPMVNPTPLMLWGVPTGKIPLAPHPQHQGQPLDPCPASDSVS